MPRSKLTFTKFIFFKILGWKIDGSFDESIKKAVIIVAPHTSWVDFIIGSFSRRILRTKIHFVAKKELFNPLIGWYFRWMGGAPLDRTSGQNKVEAIAKIFSKHDEFRLALAPEGTRKKVEKWKTGFYYIALKANAPIIAVSFDYPSKTVKINKPFYPTANLDSDLKTLMEYYIGVIGKKPEYT